MDSMIACFIWSFDHPYHYLNFILQCLILMLSRNVVRAFKMGPARFMTTVSTTT